jgi:phage shock protein PspC (stress-responsive transcriptional regulator)
VNARFTIFLVVTTLCSMLGAVIAALIIVAMVSPCQ